MNLVKMKVNELSGRALDWAVAKSQKIEDCLVITHASKTIILDDMIYSPSTNWSQCGELLEKYHIDVISEIVGDGVIWSAINILTDDYTGAEDPKTAICRQVVLIYSGSEIDIPELLK